MSTREQADLGRRALLLNIAFWTFVGLLQASNWMLAFGTARWSFVTRALGSALSTAYFWALLTPRVLRLAAHAGPEHEDRGRRITRVVLIGLILAAVATVVAAGAHRVSFPTPDWKVPNIWG